MKKKLFIITILTLCLTLFACTQKQSSKETMKSYSDKKFIAAVEKGLEKRWEYADSTDIASLDTKKGYTKAISLELDEVKDFDNADFKDSKLKELALNYINALKDSLEVAKTHGTDSFFTNWESVYNKRNETLIKINKIKEIKVSDKFKDNLDDVLTKGKEVQNNNNNKEKVQNLLNAITFEKNNDSDGGDYYTYSTTVENNTELAIKDLNYTVKLVDDQGVVVDQQYLYANDWKTNEKRKFEFTTDKTFTKTEISIDFLSFQ